MSTERVLISTHDLARAGGLREAFGAAGYPTELVTPSEWIAQDPEAALLVLTGRAEEGGGLARQAREMHVPVFVIGDAEGMAGVGEGFEEVFPPSVSAEDIVLLGKRLIERRKLRGMLGLVGETDAMHQVLERIVQIAPVQSTVLITGESGTGKELVARGIHALSPRRHRSFIAVNVAALSETLLESELFGHEKGAFTGAIDSRKGLFELADRGTIFLDEIGEMPLQTQTKLLRVLEQREFHRVGGEKSIRVDVRIVAATNQDLRQLVAIGEFRRDLYFRLNVLSIELPPLRERREDIPMLVEAFVQEVSEQHGHDFPGISPEAMEVLVAHPWPGNVRELRNLVESMVVLAHGRIIRPEDIPGEIRAGRGASLLPVPIPRGVSATGVGGGERSLRPELEFVFRTLVDLRLDVDDLRREFESYRRSRELALGDATVIGRLDAEPAGPRAHGIAAYTRRVPGEVADLPVPVGPDSDRIAEPGVGASAPRPQPGIPEAPSPGGNVVVFRPGTTIEEMERRAIEAALAEVHGNRRRAAELLGIGERTLYRKISKYELEE